MADVENQGGDSGAENEPNCPWWLKWGAKILALLGAVSWGIGGIFVAISVDPKCIFAGILEVFLALIIIMLEAAIFCKCIKGSEKVIDRLGFVKWWMKSLFYIFFAILCFALCPGISGAAGFAFILAAGFAFGWAVWLHYKEHKVLC